MAKFVMPSPEELAREYGKWESNRALKEVANWALPNSAEEFNEAGNLEYLQEQNAHFKKLSKELFGSD